MKPLIIKTQSTNWEKRVQQVKRDHPELIIVDRYLNQITELFQINNPKIAHHEVERKKFTTTYLDGKSSSQHGNYIYFPWKNTLVHILTEEDYFQVRTARNRPLITKKDQFKLKDLKVGIVGLSVGNAIAQNLAYTGASNSIKLADSDQLDLSNLNRLQASITQLGINKAEIAAQQIFEVNPYADIDLYRQKISAKNLKRFLTQPKLDLVIDECDDLTLKNYLRLSCRSLKIPLLSITDVAFESKVDLHRFDINSNSGGFKGLPEFSFEDLLDSFAQSEPLKLTVKEQLRLIAEIVGAKKVSQEMQVGSIMRAELEIAGWPQLAMTTFIGGGLASFSALLLATNQSTYSRQKSYSIPGLLKPGYLGKTADKQRKVHTKKFIDYINSSES